MSLNRNIHIEKENFWFCEGYLCASNHCKIMQYLLEAFGFLDCGWCVVPHSVIHKLLMSQCFPILSEFSPLILPSILVELIIFPNPYIMRMKRNGGRGSPCVRPLDVLKVLDGEPFRRIEQLVVVTSSMTLFIYLWSKPKALRISLM